VFVNVIVRGLLAVAFMAAAVVAQAEVLHMGGTRNPITGEWTGLASIETVPVGDPGNAPYTPYPSSNYGAVAYTYRMAKYEVTAAQYTEFLNAKAKSDPFGLYNTLMNYDDDPDHYWGCNIKRTGSSGNYTYSVASDWANRPVNYVSWYDCIRFVNWLQNGQGSDADTESGTYAISGSGPYWTVDVPSAATRATWTPTTGHWVLPSDNEWYKAAYYDPQKPGGAGYWSYPTRSDTTPINALPDPGNHANFRNDAPGVGEYTIGSPYNRTPVGAFANTVSAYGSFDLAGNVWEWNEDDSSGVPGYRALRGGSCFGYARNLLPNTGYTYFDSKREFGDGGFRVAWVPEPAGTTMLLGIIVTALLYWWRNRS
jgi:formylglycine-generating enzyme